MLNSFLRTIFTTGVDGAHPSTNGMSCAVCAMVLEKKPVKVGTDDEGNDIFEEKEKGQVIGVINIQRTKEESAQKMESKGVKQVLALCSSCSDRWVHDACDEASCHIKAAGKDEGRCCWHHGKNNKKTFAAKIVDKKRSAPKVHGFSCYDLNQMQVAAVFSVLAKKNIPILKFPHLTTTIPGWTSTASTKTPSPTLFAYNHHKNTYNSPYELKPLP